MSTSTTIYCTNCGKQLVATKKFCTGCGTKLIVQSAPQRVAQPVQANNHPPHTGYSSHIKPAQSTSSNTAATGKLLISGNGKYNMKSLLYWAFMIVCDVALLLAGLDLRATIATAPRNAAGVDLPFFGRMSLDGANSLATGMLVVAILGLIFGTAMAILVLRRYQSEINVYDNVITGKNVQGFSPTLQEFNVPMGDVMNVDVLKETGIIVRTQYGTYTSYTKKADEIRNVIMANIGRP